MQNVWLRSSLWLHGVCNHIHKDRHIEILICVSFDCTFILLLQAYLGFLDLEAEVIAADRKNKNKKKLLRVSNMSVLIKSLVPRLTYLGGQERKQLPLLLAGERGLAVQWKS